MDKNELVSRITRQVMQRLNQAPGSPPVSASAPGGGDCSSDGCPPAWDGLGTVGDMLAAGADRISSVAPLGGGFPDRKLAQLIDHTLLKAEATADEVRTLCREAAENCFMSVCVNPCWVALSARELRGTGVKVCTVIGFPLGATPARVKEFETRVAIDDGAGEIDMVLNVGALKSGDTRLVEQDVRAVVRATRGSVISKVILETCLLTPEEIRTASAICAKAGADFVKTSTGFNKGGATVDAVRIMRETVGPSMGVKASGGIRDHETALRMIGAGASRIGASASVAIVNQDAKSGDGY